MMTKRILRPLLLSALMAATACSSDHDGDPIEQTPDESAYGFVARGIAGMDADTDEPMTFRLLTFNATNFDFDNPRTGTFSGAFGEMLKPTQLNDDGSVDLSASAADHAAAILDRVTATRYLVCVSPGVKHNTNGSIPFLPADPQGGMLLASSKIEALGQFRLYQLGDMRDVRSRLRFRVSIDPSMAHEIRSIAIGDFTLSGVGAADETINTFPAQRQIMPPQRPREVALVDVSPVDAPSTAFATAEPVYIASAFYAPRSVVIDKLKVSAANSTYIRESAYIQASFMLAQNGGNPTKASFVLNKDIPELLPMYDYEFNFNVKSSYIDLSLDVYSYANSPLHEWLDVDLTDKEVGNIFPVMTIHIGTWPLNDWTTPSLDNPEI